MGLSGCLWVVVMALFGGADGSYWVRLQATHVGCLCWLRRPESAALGGVLHRFQGVRLRPVQDLGLSAIQATSNRAQDLKSGSAHTTLLAHLVQIQSCRSATSILGIFQRFDAIVGSYSRLSRYSGSFMLFGSGKLRIGASSMSVEGFRVKY